MKQAEEARREVVEFKYCNSEREHELTRKLSHDAFEARGLARSRYHTRLFQQGRPRPTNEEFDEGFDAGVEYARSNAAKPNEKDVELEAAFNDPNPNHKFFDLLYERQQAKILCECGHSKAHHYEDSGWCRYGRSKQNCPCKDYRPITPPTGEKR